jgi:type IV pilus assembly protein PilW
MMTLTKRQHSQRGFTIVEIMIALLLGILIILGVTQISERVSVTRHELGRTSRQLDNASYALRVIESDLRNAGYWGEMGELPADAALPPLCPGLGVDLGAAAVELRGNLTNNTSTGAMGYPVQGEAPGGVTCIAPLAGTEFLAIRRVNSCALGDAGCEPDGGHFYSQINSCFDPNDNTAPISGIDYLLDDDTSELVYTQRDCTTLAPRYRFVSRIYYVNELSQLVRASLEDLPATDYDHTALVNGVETMRFEYGLDTDQDGQVDLQTSLPTGTQWADVAMVRIHLMVRNEEASSGGTDPRTYTIDGAPFAVPVGFENHRRQVYSRTVSLRNVAGRRE